jgi:hypothetical protein
MKKSVLVLFMASVGFVNAQIEISNAPQWQVTFHVTGMDGAPISQANVAAGYFVGPHTGSHKDGLTDTNGIVTITARSGPAISYDAEKASYYPTRGLKYDFDFRNKTGNQWHPWNPTVDIVLKRIINPIPMYAKRIDAQPPVDSKPVGYDLMAGDWVAPYGKGTDTDIVFTRDYNRKSLQDYDYKLTVSFPKAGDGIQELPVPYKNMEGSALRSPHEAPTNGYQPQIVRLNVSHPGQKLIFDYDENRAYFFRVRTVLDENGNVKSALYGKIYGDFMQFKYYLNPTPSDRNVEFDPKRNLMKNLKPLEGVDAP